MKGQGTSGALAVEHPSFARCCCCSCAPNTVLILLLFLSFCDPSVETFWFFLLRWPLCSLSLFLSFVASCFWQDIAKCRSTVSAIPLLHRRNLEQSQGLPNNGTSKLEGQCCRDQLLRRPSLSHLRATDRLPVTRRRNKRHSRCCRNKRSGGRPYNTTLPQTN
jgi:hypothetical protein